MMKLKHLSILLLATTFAVVSCGKHTLPAKQGADQGGGAGAGSGGSGGSGGGGGGGGTTPPKPYKGAVLLTPPDAPSAKFYGVIGKDMKDEDIAKKLADINPRFKTTASPNEELLKVWAKTDSKTLKISKGDLHLRIINVVGDGTIKSVDADATKTPTVKLGDTAITLEVSADKKELISKDEVSVTLTSPTQAVTVSVAANDVFKTAITAEMPTAVSLKTQDGPVKEIVLDGNKDPLTDAQILAESGYKGDTENDPNKPFCDLSAEAIKDITAIWITGIFDLQKRDTPLDFSKINKDGFAKIPEGTAPLKVICVKSQNAQSPTTILFTMTEGYTLKIIPKKAADKPAAK